MSTGRRAILIDLGGVLVADHLREAAASWGDRLGIAPGSFVSALYAGNDDRVLIGRTSEEVWWGVIACRLGIDAGLAGVIRQDLADRWTWNVALLAGLRRLRPRASIAIVSNAWPAARHALAGTGLPDIVDAIVLSCDVGCAKPDPRIYTIALRRTGADPAEALFVDDTPGHVEAARSLGMSGHLHTGTAETLARIEDFVG